MKSIKRCSIIFLIAITFILSSCSNTADSIDNNGGFSGTIRWSCKLDGVLHQWSGINYSGGGACEYNNYGGYASLNLGNSQTGLGLLFFIQNPNIGTTPNIGTFNLNGNNPMNTAVLNFYPNSEYSTTLNNPIIINISELSNNINGYVKGTFSGSMLQVGLQQTIQITEGSFEAIRMQ